MNINLRTSLLLFVFAFFSALSGQAQTINVTSINSTCAGSSFNVDYSITDTFAASQVLNIELSDASGSFTAPVVIGSASGISFGASTIATIVPAGTVAGNLYRIRAITNPANVVSDTISGFTVLADVAVPVFNAGLLESRCQLADLVTYQASVVGSSTITYTLDGSSLAGGNTINSATGEVSYAATWHGTSTVTATAAGCNGPQSATFFITTTPPATNLAFNAGLDSVICQGSTTVVYGATASDATSITYTLNDASTGIFDPVTGSLIYNAGFSGNIIITAHATGCAGIITLDFPVRVAPSIGVPVFAAGLIALRCQSGSTEAYTATAPNATSINYSLSPANAGTIVLATGVITFDPAFHGSATVTATAIGCNGPQSATFAITTTPPATNLAFNAGLDSVICQGGATVVYDASASDATITYTLSDASAGIFNPLTGSLTYNAGFSGNIIITAHATGCAGIVDLAFPVRVSPSVGLPVFGNGLITARCQGAGTETYTATATNSTSISYSLSPVNAGTINLSTGLVTFDISFNGMATITATAVGCGISTTAAISVDVTPNVSTPTFSATPAAIRCQGAGTFILVASAANSIGITYSFTPATAGSINASSGLFTYNAAYSGSIVFTATATGCGPTQSTFFTEIITPSVTAPVFNAGLPATRCQGSHVAIFAATAQNASSTVYSLDANSLANGNTINSSTGAVSFAATWSGASTILVTANGCNGPLQDSFIVTTNPSPVITSPATRSVCSGAVDSVVTATSGPGTLYKWQRIAVGSLIAGASDALTDTIFSQTLTNISSILSDIVVYSITPKSPAGCYGAPKTITITVNPGSTVTNIVTAKTICSGSFTNIALTASSGSAFTWTVENPGGINGAVAGNSSSAINQVLTNASDVSPAIVTYIVTPATTVGCPGTPKVFFVTVNPSPTVTTPAAVSICSGITTNIALTASTGTGSSFTWPSPVITGSITGASADNTTVINQALINASNVIAGSVIYTVTPKSAAGCTGTPKPIAVTVNPKPVSNLPATASVCSGTATNIALTASTGNGSTFNWSVAAVPAAITGAAAGNGSAITQTLFNSSSSVPAAFKYAINAVSAAGCIGAVDTLPLTVNPAPVYTAATAQTICSGLSTSIPLTASTGSGTQFTWTVPTNNGTIAGPLNGNLTSINQVLTNTSNTSPGSVNYTVVPTSSLGCLGNAVPVTVTVNPAPTVITPTTATICNDAPTNITLLASTGAGSSFTRTVGPTVGGISGALSGNTSSISDVLHNSSAIATGSVSYIITPRSIAGCVGPNDTITVSINPAPEVSTAANFTICSGTATNIPLTTSLSGASTFTYATPVSSTNITGGTSGLSDNISQILTNTSNINAGNVAYTIKPTSAAGCPGIQKTITVTVNPAPALDTPVFYTICSDDTTNIALTASTSGTSTYTWTVLNVTGGATGALAGANSQIRQRLHNPSDIIPATVVYRITPTSSLGCIGNATNVTVNINPAPTVSAVSSAVICSEATTNIPLAASTGQGSGFTWTISPVTGTITGASAGTLNNIAQTLTNSSNITPAALDYIVTPRSSVGCNGPTSTIAVTVNPKPTGTTITPTTICSNTNANDTLKASIPSTFTWAQPTTIIGNIQGATAGSGPVISQVLSNPDSTNGSAGSVTYQVTAISNSGSCVGNPQAVTVVVNALPRITSPVISSFAICNGNSTNISIASNISSSVFNWTTTPSAQGFISGNVNGNGTSINQTLMNSSNSLRDSVLYTITPVNTSSQATCTGPSKTVAVAVNPTPVLTPLTDSICSGTSPNIALISSTGAGSSFTWTLSATTGSPVTGQTAASGTIINQQLTNQTFTLAGTVPYIVTPTSSYGCVGRPDTIRVQVNPLPKLNSDSARTLCSGETLVYQTVSSTGNNSRYTYSRWSNSGSVPNILTSAQTSVQTAISEPLFTSYILDPKTADYYFKLTSVSNCVLDSQRLRVTINPVPDSAGIGVYPTHMICAGVTSLNFSTRRVAEPTEIFAWSSDHGAAYQLPDSTRRHNALVSFPIAGNNNAVTVTSHVAGYSCVSLPSKRTFVVQAGNTSINPNVVMFNGNLICQASGVQRYQWGYDTRLDLDSSLIPGATAQNYQIPAGGLDFTNNFYWVMAEFTDGCVRKSYYNAPLALPGVKATSGYALKLYPNPAKSILNIELTEAGGKEITIEVYDLTGKKIRRIEQAGAKIQVQIEDLTPGYYLVNCLQDGVRVATSRFIKQ